MFGEKYLSLLRKAIKLYTNPVLGGRLIALSQSRPRKHACLTVLAATREMGSVFSVAASFALARTFYRYLPEGVHRYFSSRLEDLTRRFISSETTMVFREFQSKHSNQLFQAVNVYLGATLLATNSAQRILVDKTENVRNLTLGMDTKSKMVDVFENVSMKWKYNSEVNGASQQEMKWYELSFHKEYKDMIIGSYLPYILERAREMNNQNKVVKLHTLSHDRWSSKAVHLHHPMTFDTLAMDGDLKKTLVEDLDRFIKSKEYYRKIGKVWKRGYLLYGPPGTGKSSMIAAIANYLNFDIYNLNLSAVSSDLTLQSLLLGMSNRSILVIEDIDCSLELKHRESGDKQDVYLPKKQLTLSGLLNVIDGILSCGEGRIMVVTTNYKERIDPALLRAGRMDMHICLSYCTFSTFKQLAFNYLGISDHDDFHRIEKLMEEVKVSPAEVAGELTKDASASLGTLIKLLESKMHSDQVNNGNQKDEHQELPSTVNLSEVIAETERKLEGYKAESIVLQNKSLLSESKLAELKAMSEKLAELCKR